MANHPMWQHMCACACARRLMLFLWRATVLSYIAWSTTRTSTIIGLCAQFARTQCLAAQRNPCEWPCSLVVGHSGGKRPRDFHLAISTQHSQPSPCIKTHPAPGSPWAGSIHCTTCKQNPMARQTYGSPIAAAGSKKRLQIAADKAACLGGVRWHTPCTSSGRRPKAFPSETPLATPTKSHGMKGGSFRTTPNGRRHHHLMTVMAGGCGAGAGLAGRVSAWRFAIPRDGKAEGSFSPLVPAHNAVPGVVLALVVDHGAAHRYAEQELPPWRSSLKTKRLHRRSLA